MAQLHGDFLLELPAEVTLDNFDDTTDDDLLADMDYDSLLNVLNVSTLSNAREINDDLKMSAMPDLPNPETPCMVSSVSKRFKVTEKEEIDRLFEARQAVSTKKTTAWGLKIFQDWNMETNGQKLDMMASDVPTLACALTKFYCGARPKPKEAKPGELGLYHKNTLINIRGAINRHLADLKRNVDIVRDKDFKTANGVLDGLLKDRTRTGQSKPTKHKAIIEHEDLQKFHLHGVIAHKSNYPSAVSYNLAVHFVCRGLEFHHQLHLNSFTFNSDDSGEYVTLNHETQQKNHQGGMSSIESSVDKRMYAEPQSKCCPVKMLQLLIEKTDPGATHLFNQFTKESTLLPLSTQIWYTPKALGIRSFEKMLSSICKSAGVERKYTPHCLRATAVEHPDHQGFQARHIMFMSDHRNESSLRPYNRSVSSTQKQALSNSLSAICRPNISPSPSACPLPVSSEMTLPMLPSSNDPGKGSVIPALTMQSTNNIMSTPGFFANSSFNHLVHSHSTNRR